MLELCDGMRVGLVFRKDSQSQGLGEKDMIEYESNTLGRQFRYEIKKASHCFNMDSEVLCKQDTDSYGLMRLRCRPSGFGVPFHSRLTQ